MNSEKKKDIIDTVVENWVEVANIADIPEDSGVCIKINGEQIAIYNYTSLNKWFATQNQCPHKKENALSRGLLGDTDGEPKIACPFHKKTFSLETGNCLTGEDYKIKRYPIKVENGVVYVGIVSK